MALPTLHTGFVPFIATTFVWLVVSWLPAGAQSFPSATPAVTLNSNADTDRGNDRRPSLAGDGQGHWIAVWQSDENLDGALGKDWDILFAVSEDNGQTWSRPAPITLRATNDRDHEHSPSIATDSEGTWVAVWQGTDTVGTSLGPDADILWSRSTDTGRSWSHPTPIDRGASGDTGLDLAPRVSVAGKTWIAVWESSEDRHGAGKDFDVMYSRSIDGGATWSRAAFLNNNAADDVDTDRAPVVASDGEGGWLVVWESYDSLDGTIGRDWDLLYSFSRDDGATWSVPRPANERARHDRSLTDLAPRLAAAPDGECLLLWTSELYAPAGSDRQDWELRARPFDFKKGKWGAEEFIDASRARQPALRGTGLVRAGPRWVATWVFGRKDHGGDAGVTFAVRPDRGGWTEVAGPIPEVSCLERTDDDVAVAGELGSTDWVACWSSRRRGGGPYGTDRDLFCTHQAR
ncbi:MAG: hypothetical protein ACI8TX_000871 [Hyphomicrobiaceae bacterium]|jgi:hypothetical protein